MGKETDPLAPEDPNKPDIDPQITAIYRRLNYLYGIARAHLAAAGQEEPICVRLGTRLSAFQLPIEARDFLAIAGVQPNENIAAWLSHFKAYKPFDPPDNISFEPSFSLDLDWQRSQRLGAAINMLHFSLPEQPSNSLLKDFFPSDSKTAALSSRNFPYPPSFRDEKIPPEDRKAREDMRRMESRLQNKDFKTRLIQGLVNLPYAFDLRSHLDYWSESPYNQSTSADKDSPT